MKKSQLSPNDVVRRKQIQSARKFTKAWRDRFQAIQVPPWVPEEVRFCVCESWVGHPDQIEITERLLTDPRMEEVWKEILRKDRETGDYKHLSNKMKQYLGNARANEVFPTSTEVLFRETIKAALGALRINEDNRVHYDEQALRCRRDAKFLRQMIKERRLGDVPLDDVRKLAKDIDKAAEAYDHLNKLAFGLKGSRLFDNRQLVAKGFAVTIAKRMQGHLGSVMYGTVATLAQVALEDEGITEPAVRHWCKPGRRAAGAGP